MLHEREERGGERKIAPGAIGRSIDDDHASAAAVAIDDERETGAQREQNAACTARGKFEHLALRQRRKRRVRVPGIREERMLRLDRARHETPRRQFLYARRLGRHPLLLRQIFQVRLISRHDHHRASRLEVTIEAHRSPVADFRNIRQKYRGKRFDRQIIEFRRSHRLDRRTGRARRQRLAQKECRTRLLRPARRLDDEHAGRLIQRQREIETVVGRKIVARDARRPEQPAAGQRWSREFHRHIHGTARRDVDGFGGDLFRAGPDFEDVAEQSRRMILDGNRPTNHRTGRGERRVEMNATHRAIDRAEIISGPHHNETRVHLPPGVIEDGGFVELPAAFLGIGKQENLF